MRRKPARCARTLIVRIAFWKPRKAEAFEKAVAAIAERERQAEKRKWRILVYVLVLVGLAALFAFIARLYDVFG